MKTVLRSKISFGLLTIYLFSVVAALTWVPLAFHAESVWRFCGYKFLFSVVQDPAGHVPGIAWSIVGSEIGALTALFLGLLVLVRVLSVLAEGR